VAEGVSKGDMDIVSVEKAKIENAQREQRLKEKAENRSWERRYFSASSDEDQTLVQLGQAAGVPKDGDAEKTGGLWRFDVGKADKVAAERLSESDVRKIQKELLGW